ncbi:MAG: D-alanine--poly(phosphoribitol) ligase subunit DltA, partial [Coriobacteriales bacterium]|nr:D-alanine--poly(phosphoribitol) ligase subunit DltA [Coriobacteriales bacterium]
HAHTHPGRLAFANSAGEQITYGELWNASELLAQRLLDDEAAGLLESRSPIAVLGHKQPLMLACFLACAKSGHPYVPLDASLPTARRDAIIARIKAGPSAILDASDPATLASCDALPTNDSLMLALCPRSRWITDDDLYYILFTSGSTGQPKGVRITAGCHDSFLPWALSLLGPEDARATSKPKVYLNQAPFSFDLSVFELSMALASGSTIYALTHETQSSFAQMQAALNAAQIDVWVSTPSFAELCLKDRAFGCTGVGNVETFLFCGEVLLPETAAELYRRFPGTRVVNTFGPTEATVAVTSVLIKDEHLASDLPLPVGMPSAHTHIRIVDEHENSLPPQRIGEIVIAGPSVADGYFDQPELTAERFGTDAFGRSYRTGDAGYLDENGMLHYRGRMDFQIKLNGYRIELGDIEAQLRCLPSVSNAVVLPHYQGDKVNHLVACVVEAPSASQEESELKRGIALKEQLAEELPAYMIPRIFRFWKSFPLTANGKVDRAALSEALNIQTTPATLAEPPAETS